MAHLLARSLGRLLCVFPLTWALMLSAWPWAQLAPFTRPFQAAAIAARFDWHGQMRFAGQVIDETTIPRSYLPTWFGITLPDVYVLALVCALLVLFHAVRSRRLASGPAPAVALVIACVVVPFSAALVMKPLVYDGHRHFLFLLPPMAALAGMAIEHVIMSTGFPRVLRGTVAAAALLLAALTCRDMITLHPYEYVYFNRISGGLAAQAERFDADYWGAAYREAFDWLVHNYETEGKRRVSVATCSSNRTIVYFRKAWHAERFVLAKKHSAAELYLERPQALTGKCHSFPGEVIHTVERQGVPLVRVLRRRPEVTANP
jgi:hypothetical protein